MRELAPAAEAVGGDGTALDLCEKRGDDQNDGKGERVIEHGHARGDAVRAGGRDSSEMLQEENLQCHTQSEEQDKQGDAPSGAQALGAEKRSAA